MSIELRQSKYMGFIFRVAVSDVVKKKMVIEGELVERQSDWDISMDKGWQKHSAMERERKQKKKKKPTDQKEKPHKAKQTPDEECKEECQRCENAQ
ncbi:hypothetical protein CDAR_176041 [Caerostris darwini]|uniref:Uncharacterized protein n=1 Tax=Caerostris darwini TaxID=1538125 RepID=A0AAV4WPT9_9ARAC|nr:hypothetical protein CDAR_176041 [Caerostris darwini]